MPDSPRGLTVSKVAKDSATLDWKTPKSDGGAKILGYVVEQRLEDSEEWTYLAKTKPLDTSFTIANLEDGNGYIFRVSAENDAGLGKSVEADSVVRPKKPPGTCSQFGILLVDVIVNLKLS